ncbi:hypothetical protein [Halorubrum lipolyticum]|nr:hypothetical protein [Halorubrum lipolyticum]
MTAPVAGYAAGVWPFNRGTEQEQTTTEEATEDETAEATSERDEELNVRIQSRQAARSLDQAEAQLQSFREAYKKLMQQGAATTSESARKVFAIKARAVKFKAQVQNLQRMKALKELCAWTVAGAQSEIEGMIEEMDLESNALEMIDSDPQEIQSEIDRLQASIERDMEELDDVFAAGNGVDVGQSSMPTVEEQQLMNEIADGDMDIEDVDLDVDEDHSEVSQAALAATEAATVETPELDIDLDMGSDDFAAGAVQSD